MLGPNSKRNHIVCLDFAGPLKIFRAVYSPEEKAGKFRIPDLGRFAKAKTYLSIKVCVLTNTVTVSLVPDLTTESLILDLKTYTCLTGPAQYYFTDSGSNFLGIANLVTGTTSKKDLKQPHWQGHRLQKMLDSECQRSLNVLGSSLILQAQGKHKAISNAENVVKFLKYSLRATQS